jgi:hypothetical protein
MSTTVAFSRQISAAGSGPFHHIPAAQPGPICGGFTAGFGSFFPISAAGSRPLYYVPAAWSGSIGNWPDTSFGSFFHISATGSRSILNIPATRSRPVLLVGFAHGSSFSSFCFAPDGFSATEEIQAGPAEVSAVMALRLRAPVLAAVGALMSSITLR